MYDCILYVCIVYDCTLYDCIVCDCTLYDYFLKPIALSTSIPRCGAFFPMS